MTARPTDPGPQETAALARGGRASFLGYVLRLLARFPFLFIAGRLYGAEATGRFAYATMVVELVAMAATLGLRRGLAEAMAAEPQREGHVLLDALLLSLLAGLAGGLVLVALPVLVFPAASGAAVERWFALIVPAIVLTEVALAACAYRHDIAASVRARALVEPWILSIAALALGFTLLKADGLILAYLASMLAAAVASLVPMRRHFRDLAGWRPDPGRMARLARRNMALAGADLAEWGARRLDIFILGRFAPPEVVGIYYMAQQIASLPQRLKSSFDPILAPVLATNLAEGRRVKAALHIRQVGFWVSTAQLGVVLALGITGEAGMGLFGPVFAAGALVLALLLMAELFAAQAAVAEAALVYVARGRNLAWSVAGITIQAGLSLLLVPRFGGEGAAAALAASALILSVAKSRLLARLLGHPVAGWRWSLLLAGVPAFGVGMLVLRTPEPIQLSIGLIAILGSFGGLIWRFGFKGADRLLFARSLRGKEFPVQPTTGSAA
jgi:O-antigen/teichoic acid export membrane protein